MPAARVEKRAAVAMWRRAVIGVGGLGSLSLHQLAESLADGAMVASDDQAEEHDDD